MLKERIFLQYLKWQTRPARVRKHLERKNLARRENCKVIDPGAVRVGAVQIKATLCSSPLEYADLMQKWVGDAAAAGVQLLAFPEENNYHLMGMLPGIEKLGQGPKEGAKGNGETEADKDISEPLPLADIVRFVGPALNRVVYETFSFLARTYGMYIMAGSLYVPDGDRVVNRSLLYAPDGTLVGVQEKVHLMPVEHAGGLKGGEAFRVFPTPLGKVAMPVCMDATYFETFRVLRIMGADIVIIPIADTQPYSFWLALRGIWPRVQESLVYGIKSVLVGEILGFESFGRAGIFAPLELTPGRDGVLAELVDPAGEGLAVADLDLKALWRLREEHPYLEDQNPGLMKKYFPGIYQKG